MSVQDNGSPEAAQVARGQVHFDAPRRPTFRKQTIEALPTVVQVLERELLNGASPLHPYEQHRLRVAIAWIEGMMLWKRDRDEKRKARP